MRAMTPKQIKSALEDVGCSQARIANECDVTPSFVNQIVYNTSKSHRVRCHIADKIKKPVGEVWKIKQNPTKSGPR